MMAADVFTGVSASSFIPQTFSPPFHIAGGWKKPDISGAYKKNSKVSMQIIIVTYANCDAIFKTAVFPMLCEGRMKGSEGSCI